MAEVPLWRRDGSVRAVALVDEGDAARVAAHRWRLKEGGRNGQRYAQASIVLDGRERSVGLHRLVMGLAPGDAAQVDHKNGDGLDCRRSNLRVCTPGQNQQNRHYGYGVSKYRGVTLPKGRRRWRAQATVNGCQHYLGAFATEDEAARVAAAFRAEHMPFSAEAAA